MVEEEGFPNIADFDSLSFEIVYQVRIVEVYPQSTYSARIIPKLSNKSHLLDIETIIGYTIPTHA